jgi:hypothetical protein
MSNLASLFDVLAGLPPKGCSALEENFGQLSTQHTDITEGQVVAVESEGGVPVVDVMTSTVVQATNFALNVPDQPWLVVQGKDQSDVDITGKLLCLKMKSGIIFKVTTALTFTIGDLVQASSGVLAAVTSGTGNIAAPGVDYSLAEQAVGVVLEMNATAGYVIVAS